MKKDRKACLVLVLLLVFHLLNIFFWFNKDVWPVGKDYAHHLRMNMEFIREFPVYDDWRQIVFISMNDNPPLYYWTGTVLWFFSRSYQSLFLNSSLYLFLLLLAVYGIGKELKDRQTGLIAAMLCSFSPGVYLSAIQFNLALPTAALVSVIVYSLVLVSRSQGRRYWLLFALLFVAGMYTRQLVGVFILGPLLLTLFRLDRITWKAGLKGAGLLLAVILVLLPYYHVLSPEHHMVKKMSITGWVHESNIFSLQHLLYYLRIIPKQVNKLNTLLFAAGLALLFLKRTYGDKLILSWIIPPLVILSFVFLKFPEYTTAVIPAISLAAAMLLTRIRPAWAGLSLVGVVMILNVCFYFKNFP